MFPLPVKRFDREFEREYTTTMDTATDQSTSPKRVRIDETATNGTEKMTPMALARQQIQTHIESLHVELQPLLSKAAKDLLLAMQNAYHKQTQLI